MKKDILASEDFEPPSPVSGLGEHKVKNGSDSSLELKGKPKNNIHPEGTSFPEVSLQPSHCRLPQTILPRSKPHRLERLAMAIARPHPQHRSAEPHSGAVRRGKTGHDPRRPPATCGDHALLCEPLDRNNPFQPIRRTVLPTTCEHRASPGEAADPLAEDQDSPVPGLVHRYPDRVLFLVTDFCSTYCRYCTRSRMVGHHGGASTNLARWEEAIAYIERTPTVRDVLLSGGDPLTLSDESLAWLLSRLRQIRHVEFLRIGTKAPVVLPQRITPALTRVLKKFHPLWVSIHFTHPEELTPEVSQACERLADAGIPLGSQTVLLSGINDDVATMKALVHGLLKIRVKPYYLYQCDPILGSAHFTDPGRKRAGDYPGIARPHHRVCGADLRDRRPRRWRQDPSSSGVLPGP